MYGQWSHVMEENEYDTQVPELHSCRSFADVFDPILRPS